MPFAGLVGSSCHANVWDSFQKTELKNSSQPFWHSSWLGSTVFAKIESPNIPRRCSNSTLHFSTHQICTTATWSSWRRGTKAFCKNGIKFFSSERLKLTQTKNDTSMPITRHQSVRRNNMIISHVHLLHAPTSPHNPSSSPLRDEHHPAVPAGLKLAVNWGNCMKLL